MSEEIIARLRAAGCVFAEEEARLLVESATTPERLDEMVAERVRGVPLEHVVGWAEFAGLRITVRPGVFVPRHRTELLVRLASAALAAQGGTAALAAQGGTAALAAQGGTAALAAQGGTAALAAQGGTAALAAQGGTAALAAQGGTAALAAQGGTAALAAQGSTAALAAQGSTAALAAQGSTAALAAQGSTAALAAQGGTAALAAQGGTAALAAQGGTAALAAPAGAGRPVLLDLACGSGAIAAVVASRVGDLDVYAADIEPAAVAVARLNLAPFGGRVYQGDLFAPLPAALRGRVDVLVANVPYVPSGAVDLLPPEARLHEPLRALDGGADGLDVLRRVAAEAADWLRPGGTLLSEIGVGQIDAAKAALGAAGLAPEVSADEELDATVVAGRR